MAITPNSNFSPGEVFTAQQANNFPRGIIAVTTSTSNTLAANILSGLSTSFTAVANRNYRVSVLVHSSGATAGNRLIVGINANGSGVQRIADLTLPTNTTYYNALTGFVVWNPGAGGVSVTIDWNQVTGSILPNASTGVYHQLVIEDLGTA